MELRRYAPEDRAAWNDHVASARNGTFLFHRDFMEYHADRFEDHSLLVMDGARLLAILPANRDGQRLVSHGGLTYGGFVTTAAMTADKMLEAFDALVAYLRREGFGALCYKPVPHIYHAQPSEEDLYALFRAGADLVRVDSATSIRLDDRLPYSKSKRQGLARARKAGLRVGESDDWAACWSLLQTLLAARHDAAPVHSLDEIRRLAAAFPTRIRLFAAEADGQMAAALVIFDCGPVVHVQYIASNQTGRDLGGVDLIVDHLVTQVFADRRWFDFGISTTEGGRALNTGLARQKEMFGGRTTIYAQYRLDLEPA